MASTSDHDPQRLVLDTVPTNTPDQFSYKTASFEEVLEELSSRFILNLPEDELAEVERVCFQVEQAHWYYEDFIREEKPSFQSLPLKRFSEILFRSCPLLHHWSHDHESAFNDFMEYKTRVPVCGAVMLNAALTKCVLVKGWKASAGWSFPKGKVNEKEDEAFCAAREVLEETGFSLHGQIQDQHCIRLRVRQQPVTLFVVPNIPEDFLFKTRTRKEISKIDWFKLAELPGWRKDTPISSHKFYLITPVIR
ncbi:Dcp2, box A domain-containing protein [Hysterangium stoloniferum]|nr:Dcp2, box A domain-containing protein [Hysterangium stoloniferum]